MTTPIELKAAGRLQRVTLSGLNNASIAPEELDAVNDRWCLHPDFGDRELADADPSDVQVAFSSVYDAAMCDAIQTMHRRVLDSTGSGSWPQGKSCHPNLYPHDGYHATTVWVDHADFMRNDSLNREVTDEEWQTVVIDAKVWPSVENPVGSVADCKRIWTYQTREWADRVGKNIGDTLNCLDMGLWLAFEATRRAGCFLIEVYTGENGTHNIHLKMIPIPGSTSGFAYFPNGSCNDHVTCNIDSLLTYSLGRFAALVTHELGHNLRLEHEFKNPQASHRSVMSYATVSAPFQGYRLSGAPYEYVEDHSWPVLRRYFGGETALPIDDVSPPIPVPAPEIPGILQGRILTDGTYAVDGEVGPIPAGATGRIYIMQRIGNTPQHKLIPKADV